MDTLSQSVAVPARRWWALASVAAAQVLAVADACVVNVAVPSIRAGLHADAAEIQAVVAVYQIAYAVLAITGGRTGDIVGRKRVFLAGVIGFCVASLWCGLSRSAPILIFARAAEGGAAALMVPQVLATIHTLFPEGARARAIAACMGGDFGGAVVHRGCHGRGMRPNAVGLTVPSA
jgi:MFS family permease